MIIKEIVNKLRGEPQIGKLVKDGLVVGKGFKYGRYCFFDPSHCFLISIGNEVTFSTRVHILAHDASTKRHLGYARIGQVFIADHVFVGANVTILPGVTIGENAIIGAGAVVSRNVEPNSVYAGVPAKKICSIEDYLYRTKQIDKELWFGEEYTVSGGISEERKDIMRKKLSGGKIGLVR